MDPRLPTREFIQAAEKRARQREKAEERRQEDRKARFRWILWGVASLLLAALIADLRGVSRRLGDFQRRGGAVAASVKGDAADIAGGLDGVRYVDPAGRFSVVPPRHWTRVAESAHGFYDVVFQGPHGMDMCVLVTVTNSPSFDKLVEDLRRVERSLSADTHMDFAYVGPYRAVKRSAQLFRNRVLMLDFLTGDLEHHVQFSAPPALYDEYEPVFLRLMQTYEPGRILTAPESPVAP